MVLRPLLLNCLQCQKRSVEKSKNQCKSASKEITVKAKDRFYIPYQKVMVGNESPRFERNGSEPRDPRWRSNLGCDNSYWDVKSCSIGNEVCSYPLTYSTFRRTYRSLFAVHIPPKGNGSPVAKPPEKNRVDKTFICGLEWNFLSRASEPSASRKKITLSFASICFYSIFVKKEPTLNPTNSPSFSPSFIPTVTSFQSFPFRHIQSPSSF